MEEYLGIIPLNDAAGVLQDVHWAESLIGYFPTYTLGNILSVQLFDKARLAIAGLESQIENGEFRELLQCLRSSVHQYGRKLQRLSWWSGPRADLFDLNPIWTI
jgi:carboxypeptidase Taq